MKPSPLSHAASRRNLLLATPGLLALPHFVPGAARAAKAPPAARPILDQPMRRLRLPAGTMGRDYVLLQLRLGQQGPFDFVVDTGLTAELITPHLREALGIATPTQLLQQSVGAGGGVQLPLVQLTDAELVGAEGVALPPLNAVVTDFVQERLDPQHPVEGMLGQEVLERFDTDLDFPAGRLRLYRPGEGCAAAAAAGLVEVPAAVLNETGILGIRATSPKSPNSQPYIGIIDCGASFSALNWQAAALSGLPPRGDPAYRPAKGGAGGPGAGGVAVVGVDGRPQVAPVASVQFTFAGAASRQGGQFTFEAPPRGWQPWQPVQAAVGDLPVFAQLLGDGSAPFKGPAAVLGLDVLSQRRVLVCAGVDTPGRSRRLFISPS